MSVVYGGPWYVYFLSGESWGYDSHYYEASDAWARSDALLAKGYTVQVIKHEGIGEPKLEEIKSQGRCDPIGKN